MHLFVPAEQKVSEAGKMKLNARSAWLGRMTSRLPRFSLRSPFIVVGLCAVWFGYLTRFGVQHSHCLVSPMAFRPPSGRCVFYPDELIPPHPPPPPTDAELAEQVFAHLGDSDFLKDVLSDPRLQALGVFDQVEAPSCWVQRRLSHKWIGPEHDVLLLSLVRYRYVDDGDPSDQQTILAAIMEAIDRDLQVQNPMGWCGLQILQRPSLPGGQR